MICWFCWCIWCSFMFTFDFFDTHWSIWQCQVFFMFFISLCIYVIYAIIWFIFLFDYLIYLIIWFVWYDCDIMLFVVDVCACVEMLNELMYPENSQKKTRLKLLTGRFHPYSPATMPDETMERLTRRRLGYFEAAVLNDEAEFGPAVNARRWPHGQSWPVLESWDSHLIMCKGWPASHFFGQSLRTHQMINAIMQGQYMMYMTVFFDILIILYFLLLLILLHPFWSFIVFDISTYWSITDSFSLDSPTRHAIPDQWPVWPVWPVTQITQRPHWWFGAWKNMKHRGYEVVWFVWDFWDSEGCEGI